MAKWASDKSARRAAEATKHGMHAAAAERPSQTIPGIPEHAWVTIELSAPQRTEELAAKLAAALNTTPQFWINLQTNHEKGTHV